MPALVPSADNASARFTAVVLFPTPPLPDATAKHFGAYMFGDAAGVAAEPVHFKSTGDAVKMRALAVSGSARALALPDVPTLKEEGFANLEFSSWFGVVAPAKTPVEILDKLSADVIKAVSSPETRTKLQDMGFKVTGTTRAEFARIIRDDTVVWGKAVRGTGFKAD